MKKAFTLIETLIVIAVFAILSVVIIPQLLNGYENSKQSIIGTYNGTEIQVINEDTKELIFEGRKEDFDLDKYELVNVDYNNKKVILYVKIKETKLSLNFLHFSVAKIKNIVYN